MEKQTAVEWLIEQFNNSNIPSSQMLFKQAKEMEKQQVIDAFNDGYRSGHFEDHKLSSAFIRKFSEK